MRVWLDRLTLGNKLLSLIFCCKTINYFMSEGVR